MKNSYLIVMLFFIFLTNNSYAQVEIKNVYDYEKTPYNTSRNVEFEYDSLIKVYFYCVRVEDKMKFISSVSYKNETVYTKFISDKMFRREENVIDSIFIDSLSLKEMESYFLSKYNTELLINSLSTSFFDIGETFGLACGGAASPQGRGKEYFELLNKKAGNEEITSLLISLDPFEQAIGYLLYDLEINDVDKSIINRVEKSTFRINCCSGCGGSGLYLTPSEMKTSLLGIHKK